jgi:branched-chain amino acid transport system substrate-binding protein
MKRTFLSLVVIGLVVSLLLSGCAPKATPTPQAKPPIKVALVGPLTGDVATFGASNRDGALLAIEEWNAKGGPAGHKIEYVLGDSQCDGKAAADVAKKVVDEDKVQFIIGAVCSSETIPITEYAGPKKVLLISGTSTNPGVTVDAAGKTKPYAFRACFIDPFQGKVMAKFALDNLKAKTAAVVLDQGNDYVKGLAEFFKAAFEQGGGTVPVFEAYSKDDTDFSAILSKVKDANPDVFFIPDYYAKVSLIGAQAKQKGITAVMLGGDGWDSADLDTAAVEGGYYSNHYHPGDTRPIVVSWIAKYQAKYGAVPDALATLGYDAANLMFAAIDKAGTTDPDAVAKALEGISFDGVSGKVTFDAQHNPIKSAAVLHVVGGKILFETSVAP